MKKPIILSIVFLTVALLACATQPPVTSTPDIGAIVAQTMQALTAGSNAGVTPTVPPANTEVTPASPLTPSPSTTLRTSLLPRALYFLNADAAGHPQVFRLAPDGTTLKQITSEPVEVTYYDVNQNDGRIVYISKNQMILINGDGSGRQVLLDGGALDQNNPFLNDIHTAAWSPNGQTIAYGYQGLNLYALATGVSNRVLDNLLDDVGGGFIIPRELYFPDRFSPDGTKLLLTLGYYEGASAAIYYPASDSLVRLSGGEGALICCGEEEWTGDSASLYAANPSLGMFNPGLWRVDAASGQVTTLIAGDAGDGTFNFADEPFLAPDGQLYYFFANLPSTGDFVDRASLQLVRSAPDGVSGRTILRPDFFDKLNEALWSPDASFVIVALAQNDQVYQGGQAEIVYVDGRPRVVLVPFAREMKWGP